MAPYTVVLVEIEAEIFEGVTVHHVTARSEGEAVDEAERISGITGDRIIVFPGHIEGAYVPGWAS